MKKNLLHVVVLAAATLISSITMAQSNQTINADGVKLHVVTSNPGIFEVTSVILENQDETMLVDAQFSREDARRIVDLIEKTGKPLSTIFISYSDPDFYFGLDYIAERFPAARIISTPQTAYIINATKDEKMAIWAPKLGNNAPQKIIVPTPVQDNHIMFGPTRVDIIKPRGDEQHSCLWIPSAKVILGGIYINDAHHLWIADSQSRADRDKWVDGLAKLEAMGPEYCIPSHFRAGKENLRGSAAIDFTRGYLTSFEKALGSSATSGEVIAKMKDAYPGLDGESNLEMTAKVLKGEMPWSVVDAFPAIERTAMVDFGGDYVFRLNFTDNTRMNFEGLKGTQKGVTDNVIYNAVEVAPHVYMVYWTEPKTNIHVVHVEDFTSGKAYTNISAPDGSFTNLKGTIKLLDE